MTNNSAPDPSGTPQPDECEVIPNFHRFADDLAVTEEELRILVRAVEAQKAELTRLRAERDRLCFKLQQLDHDRATTARQIQQARVIYEEIPAELEQARYETRAMQTQYTALLIDLRALVEQWRSATARLALHAADCADELTARLAREPHQDDPH